MQRDGDGGAEPGGDVADHRAGALTEVRAIYDALRATRWLDRGDQEFRAAV